MRINSQTGFVAKPRSPAQTSICICHTCHNTILQSLLPRRLLFLLVFSGIAFILDSFLAPSLTGLVCLIIRARPAIRVAIGVRQVVPSIERTPTFRFSPTRPFGQGAISALAAAGVDGGGGADAGQSKKVKNSGELHFREKKKQKQKKKEEVELIAWLTKQSDRDVFLSLSLVQGKQASEESQDDAPGRKDHKRPLQSLIYIGVFGRAARNASRIRSQGKGKRDNI